METNTTETDAVNSSEEFTTIEKRYNAMHDLAEKLERERNEDRAEIERLKDDMLAMTVFQD